MPTTHFYFLLVLFLLAACASTPVSNTPQVTATPDLPQTTIVPTLDRQSHTILTPAAVVTATAVPNLCQVVAEPARVRHTVKAEIDYANRRVLVRQRLDYINQTGTALAEIVLNAKPNAWDGILKLERVGSPLIADPFAVAVDGPRLQMKLPGSPLPPDCALQLDLEYQLNIPPIDLASPDAYRGYLGFTPRQMNLGHWLITPAPYVDGEWLIHADTPIGEQDVLDDADWDVTLTVKNAPATLRVAAPGLIKENRAGSWRFILTGARDFSLSLSDVFQMSSQQVGGVKVELYTFADAQIQTTSGVIDSAAFALDAAAKSVTMYSDLYGAYPYERLVIVQGDFPDGMEFSGIVFVGGEYFRGFNGPTSYLMIITVHEISHQWWYSKVGNDQALNPWLDEALATYSEYVYIEEFYPALKDWWWDFRVNRLTPEGFVDSTVYEFTSRRAYINAVYLRGTQMLHALRADLGTEAFFDWLRRYADSGTARLVTPAQFWTLLSAEQIQATEATREKYLRQPEITVSLPGS
ncbi:MAG TPA: M1 family aminopeptidase [Phototrophicaceae bacterium]|nr:M1 family aminopeptidase [Phototrophicaceae bacterium]